MYGIIVLIVYAVIMMATTLLFTRKEETAAGFLTGNHNLKANATALSIAATWIWAPALFTSTEKAYTNGLPGLFWFLVPNVLCLILFIPFAKKIRREMPMGITLSGYMAEKYKSDKVKTAYVTQLGVLSLLSTAVQLLAGGKLLSVITGMPFWIVTIILAVIAYSYSQFSGIKASVTTDAVQMIFMLVACAAFLGYTFIVKGNGQNLIVGLGGITGDFKSLFDKNGLEIFLGFGLPSAIGLISGPFGDQSFWQRAFSVKKNKIGFSFGMGALLFGMVPLTMGILGYVAAGNNLPVSDMSIINFEVINQLLPSWMVLPFLFMVISGLLSTVDSNLCSVASLSADVNGFTLKKSKITMLIVLAVSILIANIPGLTVTHLFLIYGAFRASTLLPTIMTLKGVKLTANGVVYGIIITLLVGFPIFAYGTIFDISIYKTIGSVVNVLLSGVAALIISRREAKRI